MAQLRSTMWGDILAIDEWLDVAVADKYKDQPMAQDWARVAKLAEETGEAISELILMTGQNPRKGTDHEARQRMIEEIADAVWTGIFAIQHFTKDTVETEHQLAIRLERIRARVK